MFEIDDTVEVISDGRSGVIKQTRGRIDAVNKPGAHEVIYLYLVRFDNDIMKDEWFKPEQLRSAAR